MNNLNKSISIQFQLQCEILSNGIVKNAIHQQHKKPQQVLQQKSIKSNKFDVQRMIAFSICRNRAREQQDDV